MLNSEFRKLEESVDKALSLNRQKIRDAISEHTTSVKKQLDTLSTTVSMQFSTTEAELSRQQKKLLWRVIKGRILFPALTALSVTGGIFLVPGADGVAGKQDCEKYPDYQRAGKHAGERRQKPGGDVRQWRERGNFWCCRTGEGKIWTVGDKNAVRRSGSKRILRNWKGIC